MIALSPRDFWTLTPWQFYLALEAYFETLERQHDHDARMMWNNAMIIRTKNTAPPLDNFLIKKRQHKTGINENAIIARMKAHNKNNEDMRRNSP